MGLLLEGREIAMHFGGLRALDGVDIALGDDEFLALVGPNGAGKSTMLEVLAGGLRPTHGRVELRGRDITHAATWRRARAGLVRTFQANRLFADQTVSEHIALAIQAAAGPRLGDSIRRMFGPRDRHARAVREVAARFGLAEVLDERAEDLPFGLQRLLGIAMGVATCGGTPGALLLDEPLAGMNESETDECLRMLARLRADGFSILMVEHNMSAVSRAADRIVVLDMGRKLAEGPPAEVLASEAVVTAYLGSEALDDAIAEEVADARGA